MTNESFNRERLLELSAKSCDESLTSAEFVELESILLASAEARDAFRDYGNVHVTLANCYGAAGVAESPGSVVELEVTEVTEAAVVRAWPRVALAAAAVVALGVGGYFVMDQLDKGTGNAIVEAPAAPSAGGAGASDLNQEVVTVEKAMPPRVAVSNAVRIAKAPPQRVPPRPGLIAQVVSVGGVKWAEGSPQPKANAWLGKSTLKLEKGLARIVFAQGASATLRGPAEIDLVSENMARLEHGQLVARVPKRATGFTVRTDSVNVVDLGTAFGMNAGAAGEIEVQVFEGEVELKSPQDAPGAMAKPKRVRTGQSFRARTTKQPGKGAGVAKKKIVLEAVNGEGTNFHRLASYNAGLAKTSGPVRYVAGRPEKALGGYEHNKNLFVFRERAGVWLEEPLEVNYTKPGNYSSAQASSVTTGSGFAVRSYLLHFNPVGQKAKGLPVKAAITFDEPIVGIIAGNELLKATDAKFAEDLTKYRAVGRAIDPPAAEGLARMAKTGMKVGDRVILSGDRRTVRVDWNASSSMDEVRVLVRDEG